METLHQLRARIERESEKAIELLRVFRLIGLWGAAQFSHTVTIERCDDHGKQGAANGGSGNGGRVG